MPRVFLFLLAGGLLAAAERVPWTTSRLKGSPDPPPPYRLVRTFPLMKFKEPVFLAQDPTANRWWVAEIQGQIHSFAPGSAVKNLVLNMGRGISAFSFHPQYKTNGQIFVFSHLDTKKPRDGQWSRVSRFEVDLAAPAPKVKPGSERIIVEWTANGHNGGEAIIGPDGYLYITTGDGSGGSDLKDTGQGVDDLLAVMMRLDVNRVDPGRNYSIPPDNPFVNTPFARGEIWAYGFRNPWRFTFDPVTGQPWVGDVGQDLWEMIELVSRGSNHGWSVREGSHPFHPNRKAGPGPFTDPIVQHHHTECRSITGGYFYSGAKFPELVGAYLYGDYEYGKMWGLRYDHQAKKVTWHEELADTAVKIASFALARDGSFYAIDYNNGGIYELGRRPPATPVHPFPRKLSETGLFTSVKGHAIAPGVTPYSINAGFWSDGARKDRFFALPGGAFMNYKKDGAWEFDDGAVTVKTFSLEMEQGNPATARRIETRVVVKQDDHWVGYSYMWNDSETDGELVEARGIDRTFRIRDAAAPGGAREQVWHYPSRNECMFCHSRAAGFVLGLNTAQMNRDGQLERLEKAGYFKKPPPAETARAAYADPFGNAPIEDRVRAYLSVNCAMCHVSDGGGNAKFDVGFKNKLAEAKLIGEKPIHEAFEIRDALLVAPGDPARSVVLERIRRRGTGQMPPSSTNVVDEAGVKLIEQWIRDLK
ncbi:MAG: hypothetical protein FJW39_21610 [Acidobacteria bacterium]|nr:hypothetical protein [Acidobacteriota bacterium]